jgi:uncharacterized membrane protein
MNDAEQTGPSTNTRRLVIALSISVALNLFLLGFMSARGLGRREHRHPPPHRPHPAQVDERPGPRAGGAPHVNAPRMLRKARRLGLGEEAQAVLKEQRAAMRERRKGLRAARESVARAMTAEPFDPAALEAAFDAQRQAHSAAQAAAHATMVELASKLDADGRARLLREGRERRGGMKRKLRPQP